MKKYFLNLKLLIYRAGIPSLMLFKFSFSIFTKYNSALHYLHLNFLVIYLLKQSKCFLFNLFFSFFTGLDLQNISSLGRIGFKTISLYIFTTLIAITISLLVGHIINPGQGMTINENIDSFNLSKPHLPRSFIKYNSRQSF